MGSFVWTQGSLQLRDEAHCVTRLFVLPGIAVPDLILCLLSLQAISKGSLVNLISQGIRQLR